MTIAYATPVPLSPDALRKLAPSVFAEQAAPGVSNRYQFVRTVDVLTTMEEAGFRVVQARQSLSHSEDGGTYVKHSLRLTHSDYLGAGAKSLLVGDVVPQVVVTNAHNRTSSFLLDAGLYRLACLNGMMISAVDFAGLRVLHSDTDIHQHIADAVERIKEVTFNTAVPMIEKMSAIEMTEPEANEFALAATFLKWGEERPDHAPALLECRRDEDSKLTLWNVLNRVQENAVKGGYKAKDRSGHDRTTPPIRSVDRDRDFNLAIWELGAQVALSA